MSSAQPKLLEHELSEQIRSRPCPACYLCRTPGVLLHEGVKDRLFEAPGIWNLRRCPNPGCGLLWLDPMPVDEDIAKAYRRYYTHQDDPLPRDNFFRRVYSRMQSSYLHSKFNYHYTRRTLWDRLLTYLLYLDPPRRESIDLSVFLLKLKPNGRLLEVGCGSGATLKFMEGLGWQVEGVDFDLAAVEQARKKGLAVHLGTLAEQSLPENTFDAIAARHFIEHVPDPIDVLRECRRLLKPGGLLVLITPNANSWGHRLYLEDWRGLEPPRHLRIFTRSSLTAACTQAGLNTDDCRSMVRANTILLESKMLRRTGKAYSVRRSLWAQLWAELTGLLQWAVSLVDPDAGEEIVAISSK